MLIQFRTENHRSLQEEQTLSLVAAVRDDDPRLLHVKSFAEPLLPVVAIYGANASGKSNVFHALNFMRDAVAESQRGWAPEGAIPRQPFALSAGARNLVSVYEVEMLVGGVRHRYGFTVDDEKVEEEWLYAWPRGKQQMWFAREGQRFVLGKNLTGENKTIMALTRPNSLFLSAAAQNNHEQLFPVYRWFVQRLRMVAPVTWNPSRTRRIVHFMGALEHSGVQSSLFEERDTIRRKEVLRLLASADLGIIDFKVEEAERPRIFVSGYSVMPAARPQVFFKHQSDEDISGWLSLDQESAGTLSLLGMLPDLVAVLERRGVLCLDELDASLHPMLVVEIVKLFQNSEKNRRQSQLMFTTHNTTLLGNLFDGPPLRRDQVWFTEKDRSGATHLYPLTDFHPRKPENLERGYLQGRYGAVPFMGEFVWQPVDEESAKKEP